MSPLSDVLQIFPTSSYILFCRYLTCAICPEPPPPPSPKKVQFVWGKKFFLLLYSVVRCYHPNYNTACKQKQVWRGQIGFHINSFYGLWMKLKIYSTHLVFIGFFFFFKSVKNVWKAKNLVHLFLFVSFTLQMSRSGLYQNCSICKIKTYRKLKQAHSFCLLFSIDSPSIV